MNRKVAGAVSLGFIVICITYIIYDIATGKSNNQEGVVIDRSQNDFETDWAIVKELKVPFGELSSVKVAGNGNVICAGNSFIASYKSDLSPVWNVLLEETIYAVTEHENIIYAATREEILVFNGNGNLIETWGPYDDDAILTSISANKNFVAFADAGNKLVFVCDKEGALISIVGHPGNQFIIPSAYFDVHLTPEDSLVVANPGKRAIEFRNIDGELIREFGEEGDGFEDFCGCCNPSHFDFLPDGNIVTAEKGINRIKVLDPSGKLIGPVAQPSYFTASIPVDISVSSDGLIYAANRMDSKVYVFQKLY